MPGPKRFDYYMAEVDWSQWHGYGSPFLRHLRRLFLISMIISSLGSGVCLSVSLEIGQAMPSGVLIALNQSLSESLTQSTSHLQLLSGCVIDRFRSQCFCAGT